LLREQQLATAVVHIPAGVGVLEGIFVALFGQQLPVDKLLAALLVYRAVYYLAPLSIAALTYFTLELYTTKSPRPAGDPASVACTSNRPSPT
jgi:uncharacterized membrane protein YbhN (UPF0104 family)